MYTHRKIRDSPLNRDVIYGRPLNNLQYSLSKVICITIANLSLSIIQVAEFGNNFFFATKPRSVFIDNLIEEFLRFQKKKRKKSLIIVFDRHLHVDKSVLGIVHKCFTV